MILFSLELGILVILSMDIHQLPPPPQFLLKPPLLGYRMTSTTGDLLNGLFYLRFSIASNHGTFSGESVQSECISPPLYRIGNLGQFFE